MRIGTLLGITLGVAACADTPSPLTPEMTQPPALSSAVPSTHLTRAFSAILWVSCANDGLGENVALSGELQIQSHAVQDQNGGEHLSTHVRPAHVVGVGEVSGLRYRGTGGAFEGTRYSAAGEPRTWTFVNNFRIIGQGPNNNVLVHMTIHQSYNAAGELKADVDISGHECR